MYLLIAHPDDEALFFLPFLDAYWIKEGVEESTSAIHCWTCQDDVGRNGEFKDFLKNYSIERSIYANPIKRGFLFSEVKRVYKFIKKTYLPEHGKIVTHSLYGDYHFHPQHSAISIAALLYCLRYKVNLINAEMFSGSWGLIAHLYKRTLFKKLSSFPAFFVKIILIFLSRIFFKKEYELSATAKSLSAVKQSYKTQDLSYPSFQRNFFLFREKR